jgi:hypothetical protein
MRSVLLPRARPDSVRQRAARAATHRLTVERRHQRSQREFSFPKPRGERARQSLRVTDAALDRVIDAAYRAVVEWRLAIARVAAALVVLNAMWVGFDAYHSPIATRLTAAYVVYSVVVLALQQRFPVRTTTASLMLHLLDFLWATAATALSGGASSHTFMLFLLVIAAAATSSTWSGIETRSRATG